MASKTAKPRLEQPRFGKRVSSLPLSQSISKKSAKYMQDLIDQLAHLDGRALLLHLIEKYLKGRIALVSSFGTESVALLHMVASIDQATPVIFIDTGKLFVETKLYRQKLVRQFGLRDVRIARPLASDLAHHDPQGTLHRSNADHCCHIRKTLPLESALDGFDAWITGRKRFHGGERSQLPTMEWIDGRLKIDPLAHFSRQDIADYIWVNELPEHPLAAAGYTSIGCVPCTAKSSNPDDPRAGRWAGQNKSECGIHWSANGRLIRITRPGEPLASGGGC
jgi:phosphoadenosine phosphosulfate reductase